MDFTNPIIAQRWDEVVFRINAGEMPPEDEKQPSATEIGNLADTLVEKIREGSAARMAKRGKVQQYRLSLEPPVVPGSVVIKFHLRNMILNGC